ncbi:MAG: DNA gyrase inhibitor YacG [Nitrospira sp.]|nr:DNA gyrase inhibitor YacG [Candidatus Manganitrophaceae bacterium]HIL34223.1 DNA gyrase inhibitor YacG [Candidatus Manganitrophaceae bacterium]
MTLICSICDKAIAWKGNPFRPFCSEHCKLIDLGNWATGSYRMPAVEDEDGEEVLDKSGGSPGQTDLL